MALKLIAFGEALASFDRLVNLDLAAIQNLADAQSARVSLNSRFDLAYEALLQIGLASSKLICLPYQNRHSLYLGAAA